MGRLTHLSRGNGTSEYRYYDGDQCIQRTKNDGTVIDRTVWGIDHDEVIARWTPTNGWLYHHQDAIGSTVAITDGGGNVVEQYKYDAFGQEDILDPSGNPRTVSAVGNPWMFTGQELMADLGLCNYKNRFYLADLGRFLQQDPVRFDAGDLNLYRYCGNDPFNRTDSTGLEEQPETFTEQSAVFHVQGDGKATALTAAATDPKNSGPSGVAVAADTIGGAGLPVIPKPSALGSASMTSPASVIARTSLPDVTLSEPLPAPTYNNPNIMSTKLGTVAGRVVPAAGVVVAVVDTAMSSNPLRTGMGHVFGFAGSAIGGAAGVIAATPTGGLAVPVTGTVGVVAGGYMGNRVGTGLYDFAAILCRSSSPPTSDQRTEGGSSP
jgi:RHS repeat-associated protein